MFRDGNEVEVSLKKAKSSPSLRGVSVLLLNMLRALNIGSCLRGGVRRSYSKLAARPIRTESNLPVIDLEPYYAAKAGECSDEIASSVIREIAGQIGWACRNVGFLLLRNHSIPEKVIEEALSSHK